jgi:hypothetical protein
MVRDLIGTIETEGATIGVLFSMYDPTREMKTAAMNAGTWKSETWKKEYPRIQLITVEEAFNGKRVEYPGKDVTLQAAQPDVPAAQENLSLFDLMEKKPGGKK